MIPDDAVEAAARAMWQTNQHDDEWVEDFPTYMDYLRAEAIKALEAAAPHLNQPRTITTEEDLNELPVGTVVLSEEVTHHEGGWALSYQRWQDGDWHRGARSGSTHPDNFLPVTVLCEPESIL